MKITTTQILVFTVSVFVLTALYYSYVPYFREKAKRKSERIQKAIRRQAAEEELENIYHDEVHLEKWHREVKQLRNYN